MYTNTVHRTRRKSWELWKTQC